MAVVGGDERQAEIFFELEEARMDSVLRLQTLILDLQIEILFAENVRESAGSGARRVVVVLHQAFRDFAFQTSRQADQATRMLGQKLLADPRLVIKAV